MADIAPFGDKLAVAGSFDHAGGHPAHGLAFWSDAALDTTPPTVAILSPTNGAVFATASVSVQATVTDGSASTANSTPPGLSASLAPGTSPVSGTLPLAAEGANLLVVSATDASGNTGQTSVTVYRDTIRPTIAILSPAEGSVFGTNSVGFVLDVRDVSATTVQIGADALVLPAGGGTPSIVLTLGEGSHSILVSATDVLGNVETATRTVFVDLSAPAVTILDPQTNPVPCFGPGSSPISVTVRVVDQTASQALFQPGGATGVVAAGGGELTRSVPLAEGANLISIAALDDAGNEGTASFTAILDTTAPEVALLSPPPSAVLRGTGVDVAISAQDPLPGSGIDHVELYVDGDLHTTFAAPPYETSLDTTALIDGLHLLGARAVDGKGNAGSATLVLAAVDNTPPTLMILEPSGGATVGATIAFTVLASDGTSGITTAVLAAGANAPTPVDPSFVGQPPVHLTLLEASVDTSLHSDGPLTLSVTAIDAAGNESQVSVVVVIDNSAPPLCALLPADQSLVSGIVPIVAEVSGNFATLELRVDGTTVAGPTASALVSVLYDTRQRLDGALAIEALVSYGAGLTLTCTSHVTVDNVSFELTPTVLNLKNAGNAPIHARLEGPSVGLLLPTEAHGIQLRVCGGSPVASLAGWAGDDALSDADEDGVPELSVRFARSTLASVIQAGIACQTIERGSLVEVELWAEVSATSQGYRIGSTLVRIVGNP